ncbi:MAG TPA: prolyl oligopeptidase family serine peptidase [Vicinamibacterales bacterium]|nr:prolyl oligopeptidase family serine peptidase [Vicinamibacterales bacterium]
MKPLSPTEQHRTSRWTRLVLIAAAALLPLSLLAQSPQSTSWADEIIKKEGYVTPPKEVADAVLAPRHLNVTLSNLGPAKDYFLDTVSDGPVEMRTFSRPFHELGGVFLDFRASRARSLTIRNDAGITLISATDGSKKPLTIPTGVRISNVKWSADGKSVLYFAHTDDATHIWTTDIATNRPRQITRTPVLATLVTDFEVSRDGTTIAVVLIPDGRPAMPAEPPMPMGPEIKVSVPGEQNRLRTYASLMSTPYQHDLLEWHATGQVSLINVASGAVQKAGTPTMVRNLDVSPDGKYLRVTRTTQPFSYIVPTGNFGQVEEVWDATGRVLTEISKRELNVGVVNDDDQAGGRGGRGGGAGQTGKRELSWHPQSEGFTYLEQEAAPEAPEATGDTPAAGRAGRAGRAGGQAAGGRGGAPARPDRVMQWLPPFTDSSTRQIYESRARMQGHRFSEDMKVLFFSESQGQNSTDYAVYLDTPAERYTLARSSGNDIYSNPGSLMSAPGGGGGGGRGGRGGGGGGGPVLMSADGTSVFYSGTAYDRSPEENGPKTFIDKVDVKTGAKERVFESSNDGVWERVSTVVDINTRTFVISRESPTTVTQQYLWNGTDRKQLTNNEDLAPDLTNAPKQRFTVERPDGFRFRVQVTLPPGYQPGTRLPALFWFYPREYSDQETYDRPSQTFNKHSFQNFGMRSMHYLARLGYAIVEPDSPIVGPAGMMNNNYEHDLRNNLSVVIDELDRRGLIDRSRLALGGHSYGAFSTVNAMVHTPFFKAGIAGDGNYNRTLTPLGFQSERRIFWDARDVYVGMSPFFQANNLTGALLMYHGIHDQNVGTAPDNSIRLFHALNGLGKTVSLYMYPLEDHGPASKETLLDLWARWAAWLDKYVKNADAERSVNANGTK